MSIDAFAPFAKNPASLKFHTHFSNVTVGAVTLSGLFRSALTGTDALTGYNCVTDIQSFFDSFAVLEVQYFPEDLTLTTGTLTTQLEATMATSTLSSVANAKDLVFDYKYRATTPGSDSKPQVWLTVYRVGAANRSDVEEIYESFIMMFPADLKSRLVLGGNHYFSFFDYKTDGYLSQGYGDLRLIGQVYKSSTDSNLRLDFRIDNNANGVGVVPSVATSTQTYQFIQFPEADIPLGVPLLFESYIRRPAKINVRSTAKEPGASLERYERDLVGGVWKTCWTNLSTGEFSHLANFVGGVQMGAENLPIGRLFRGMYTPGTPAMQFRMTDWQVWDKMPAHSSLRRRYTYYLAKFYAPLRGSLALTNGTGSATFTRATAAWEFNHISKLVSIPSGAIRMRGYRPVVNRANSSEGAFSATTRASSSTGNVDVPTGKNCTTSTKLVEDSTAASSHFGYRTISVAMLGTYKVRQYFKAAGRTAINMYPSGGFPFQSGSSAVIDLTTGAVTGTASSYVSATLLADGWVEVISTHVPTATGNQLLYIELRSGGSSTYTGDGTSGVLNTGVMAVNITPNALTTVPEYVSVGVLSSPWHGAGADGVKYFSTYEDGTDIADADCRGAGLNPNQIINTLLWCRDLTNAAWTKTNVTAALTQTGIDGQANACTLLTATADNATISQTITAAAAAGCAGFKVKRSVGTGAIYFSRNGGTSWLDVTSEINASDFSLVKIENTSVTNPQIMFRIATSGDAIIVDAGINHLGSKIASCPILTTSASVTVNAETLTYPTTSNIDNLQGSILATFTADSYSSGMGNIVGSSTAGLATSSSYTCQAKDGTNTVNGSAASPSGTIKIGMAWDANLGTMYAIGENGTETSGTYDGSLGLSTIAILPSVDGYIKDVACFNRVLSNSEVQSVFNS